MLPHYKLIDSYRDGPASLRCAIAGMSDGQLDAAPIPGRWTTRQTVCHIAEFELVYADRMKRVIAEREPTFFGGDPDTFAAGLAYSSREMDEELQVIELIRRQMTRILRVLGEEDFQRIGKHSENGPLSLEALLQGIVGHLPHHVRFIEQKRAALDAD